MNALTETILFLYRTNDPGLLFFAVLFSASLVLVAVLVLAAFLEWLSADDDSEELHAEPNLPADYSGDAWLSPSQEATATREQKEFIKLV